MEEKSELIEAGVYKRELSIEIPPALVQAEIDEVVTNLRKRAKIPGFRPGKVPIAIIKKRYSELLKEEVLNKLVPIYYQKALKKHNLKPLHAPEVTDIHFKEGEPLRFKALFEKEPDIEIKDYIGIQIEKPEFKLDNEDVNAALKRLQERAAEMVSIDNRPAQEGDYLIMDISWNIVGTKGKPVVQKEAPIFLGSADNLPQLNDQLKGLSLGEEKEFTLNYPENWQVKHLARKKVHYQVELKEIKEKRLPPIDDNFAKDLGEFANLAELKDKVAKDLTEQEKKKIEEQTFDAIIKKIIEKNPLEPPEIMLKHELDARARQLIQTLAQQGIDPQRVNLDWDKFRQEHREEALKEVKKKIVLNQIATQEGLKISEEELKTEITKIAKNSGESFAAVSNYLTKEGKIDALKEQMLRYKALDFLRKKAIIIDKGK